MRTRIDVISQGEEGLPCGVRMILTLEAYCLITDLERLSNTCGGQCARYSGPMLTGCTTRKKRFGDGNREDRNWERWRVPPRA